MKIAISIGHSSKEQGATTKDKKTSEFVFNSCLASLIKKELETHGITAVITNRLTDGGGTGMSASAKAINATNSDIAIELHCNAFNSKAKGCETLYWHSSAQGKKLAQIIQKEVATCLSNPNRGVKAIKKGDRGSTVLYKTNMPCTILEPFFIDSPEDYRNAFEKMDELASSISKAILIYFSE